MNEADEADPSPIEQRPRIFVIRVHHPETHHLLGYSVCEEVAFVSAEGNKRDPSGAAVLHGLEALFDVEVAGRSATHPAIGLPAFRDAFGSLCMKGTSVGPKKPPPF